MVRAEHTQRETPEERSLYALARPGREAALEALTRTWRADEVVWLDGRVAQVALGGHWRRAPQVLVAGWD